MDEPDGAGHSFRALSLPRAILAFQPSLLFPTHGRGLAPHGPEGSDLCFLLRLPDGVPCARARDSRQTEPRRDRSRGSTSLHTKLSLPPEGVSPCADANEPVYNYRARRTTVGPVRLAPINTLGKPEDDSAPEDGY